MWADRLVLAAVAPPPGLPLLNAVLAGYWRVARSLL